MLDTVCLHLYSAFIRDLFPENLEAEKRGRPTTSSSKIKVKHLIHKTEMHTVKLKRVTSDKHPVPKL